MKEEKARENNDCNALCPERELDLSEARELHRLLGIVKR